MRASTRYAAYALLILSGVTCTDGPTAPHAHGGPALLILAPTFSLQAQQAARDLSAFGLAVDNIHIHIDHPPAAPFDTVVVVPAGADSVTLDLSVILNQPTEQLTVQVELRHGNTVLYSGTQVVTASVGNVTNPPPAQIPINYVGPGAALRNFSIAPHDTAILVSGTVPFRVTSTDANGQAVIGVQIHWTVSNAALGTVDQASGIFTPAGGSGTTWVVAATPNGLRDSASVVVSVPPARLALVGGGSQTGAAGTALAQPVVVQVQGSDGSPVAGIPVAFGAGTGGATADPAIATSGADGNAQTVVTLGHGVGAQTIVASAAGVSPLTIAATAVAGAAGAIAKVSGDAQSDTLGAVLAKPFVVKVTDAFGNAVAGATVTWARVSGSGTLAATSTTTDATGSTSVVYTLGSVSGIDTVSASLGGVSGATVRFTASAHPRAAKILKTAGDGQSAPPDSVLPAPLTVLVTDSLGVAIPGVTVNWTLSGPGSVSPASSITDAAGHASTTMTLGRVAGTYVINAALANGPSVTFTEFAVLPAVDHLNFVTQPSNVVSAAFITPPVQVELLDAAGHRDTAGIGASATVALGVLHGPPGGHVRDSLGFAADTVAAVKGLATFHVGNDIAGTYVLLATSPAAASDSSASYVVAVGPAAHLTYIAGPGASLAAMDTTAIRPTVEAQDVGGNAVPGASVTWVADSGGGTLVDPLNPTTPASSVVTTTDASGRSSVQWWLGSAGNQVLRAYLTSATGTDTIPFSTGVYGSAARLAVTSVIDTAYASGSRLPLVVQVEDANGNPVPMAGVPVGIHLDYYFCTGPCTRAPAGARPAFSRAPGARIVPRGAPRPPRPSLEPMRWPAPSISRTGAITFNRGPAIVPAPAAARARAGLGISKTVTASGAYPYGSGVFDTLPVVPYPTLIGDTVVTTDSTGKAVFANLDVAGLAGLGYPVDVFVYDTSVSALGSVYTSTFHLLPGAPYAVYAAYDSVHQAVGRRAMDVPEVAVLDSVGNGIPGVTVNFSVAGGGGSLDSTYAVTNYSGSATVPGWTLGGAAGANSVQATAAVSGPKASATVTAVGHTPAALVLATGLSTSIVDSTIISPSPEATIADFTKTWALNDSGVTITPGVILVPPVPTGPQPVLIGTTSAVTTSPSGTASFIGLGVHGTRGSKVALVVSATGMASDTSTVVSITSGPAASLGLVAGEALDSTHTVGALTRQVQVVVKDTAGYGIQGAPVTFSVANFSTSQCLIGGGTYQYVTTDAQGVASASVALPSAAASCVIYAASGSLAGSPIMFREIVAPANYDVWIGLSDTTWTNPGNWSTGTVPTSATNVYIPYVMTTSSYGNAHHPGLAAAASVANLNVENLAVLELNNWPLYVYGSLDGAALTAHAWGSSGTGTGYVEMMTPGTTIAESVPYRLVIGDSTSACTGWAASPVTVVGIDSARAVTVNCPLAISGTANSWLTSRGDVTVQHHGTVQITGASTWLYVEGSLYYKSDQSSEGLLTGGSIQVMGPGFYQDTVAGALASYKNFYSTGTSVLMENNPYGGQMNQTVSATSSALQFSTLSLVNFAGGYTASLAAPGATTYNVANGLYVSSGNPSNPHYLSIPAGVTLNAGSVFIGTSGHINVSGTLHVVGGCSSSIGAFVTVNPGGSVTPSSCYP